MSLPILPFEFYWARKIIDYSTLISTNVNEDSKLRELDVLITKTLKLFKKEITDLPSLHNVNILVSLLEELINNLNEVNTSLIKALPNFDKKILPLFAKYAEVVVFQARSSASEKDYVQYMKNFEEFLTNLSIHPTLQITPSERIKVLLSQLTTLVTSGSIEDVNESEQVPKKNEEDDFRNENKETCNKETEGHLNTEPITVVPETPLKNSEPACVGLAAIRGIIPLSSGCLLSFSTPPPNESGDVELPSQLQSIENSTNLHTPPAVMLSKLQKKLRSRFPIPHVVTPSEKNTQRSIMRILRSQRRRKPAPWNIFDSRSPSRAFSLRRRTLFVEPESEILDHNSSSSQLALYLSPDVKNDTAPSILPTASPKNLGDEERKTPLTSSEMVKPPVSSQKSPLFEENENKMNLSSDKRKNAETYDELQKSIEGNLMGCEASPSDVELMDEIESSLNQEGEEKDLSYQESPVFMDPITIATKTNDFSEIRSQFLSVSTTNGSTTPDSVKSSEKKNLSQASQERRRSSRLAGVPVLSLKYRTEPLPDCRRASTKKKRSCDLESDTFSSPSKKFPSESAVGNSPVVRNSLPTSPVPAQIQPSPAKVSVSTPIIPQLTWQEVRLLLPPCWANILDGHIKTHHPDELLRYGNGERCPTVYCNCTARQSSEAVK